MTLDGWIPCPLHAKRENSSAKSLGAYLLPFILMFECAGVLISRFHAALGGTGRCS